MSSTRMSTTSVSYILLYHDCGILWKRTPEIPQEVERNLFAASSYCIWLPTYSERGTLESKLREPVARGNKSHLSLFPSLHLIPRCQKFKERTRATRPTKKLNGSLEKVPHSSTIRNPLRLVASSQKHCLSKSTMMS